MKWFAVMTNPSCEEIANRNLRRAGFYTFYPFQKVRRRRKRANVDKYLVEWINKPYYPGYLFVAIRGDQGAYTVNETHGVSTVVYCGPDPLEIPTAVMDRIMSASGEDGLVGAVDTVSRRVFKQGQLVRFQDNSPMSGLLAQIALDNGKEIKVWLEVLGANRVITVDPSAVAEIA
jgi:transcription antitermination factor NusG